MAKRRSLEDAGYDNILAYHPDEDYYSGITTKLPEVTVTGNATKKKKGLYPVKYRYNPDKWVSARTKQLTTDDVAKAYTAATVGLLPNYISAASNLVKGNVKRALSDAWLYNAESGGNSNMNLGVVGFSTPEGSLFSSASKAAKATSKEWTAAQDAAIAKGDMAEAQRLRDLHFQVSAPDADLPVQYHGSDSNLGNTIEFRGYNDPYGTNHPLYTSSYKEYADGYHHGDNHKLYSFYINENSANLAKAKKELDFIRLPKYKVDNLIKEGYKGTLNNHPGLAEEMGVTNADEITVFNPQKYKLANAVTYDDKGVRIPLGERDNFKLNDIRYSWLAPFIGLGTLGTLYRASNKRNLENNGYK